MSHRIRDIPQQDRPRERLLRLGPEALSDAELLAIFINTGIAGENAIQVAQRLIREVGALRELSRQEPGSLAQMRALGPAKAALLAAAFELGRRAEREKRLDLSLETPEQVHAFIGPEMQALAHESVRLILLDTKNCFMRMDEIFRGTLNEATAHPREIFKKAIAHAAHGFVLVHNHPSGDPTPSGADIAFTRSIRESAKILKIEFHDHIIIGSPGEGRPRPYFSFMENGILP